MAPPAPARNLSSEPAVPGSPAGTAQLPDKENGKAHLEALLQAKKLDRTLTTTLPAPDADAVTPFGITALDAKLLGGLRRGHLSEIVGEVSTGRTSLAWAWLASATARGETAALIDAFDRFDPPSAAACGIELSRMLWVRGQAISKTDGAVDSTWLPGARAVQGPGTLLERTIDRALKALNLVLQSGVCTAVVLDFADVPLTALRRVPMTTWLRVQRVIEGTDTACVLLAPVPLARSSGGVTITTGSPVRISGRVAGSMAGAPVASHAPGAIRWAGAHERSRRISGLEIASHLSSPRRTMTGEVAVSTTTHAHRDVVEPAAIHLTTTNHHIAPSNHEIDNCRTPGIIESPNPQIANSQNSAVVS